VLAVAEIVAMLETVVLLDRRGQRLAGLAAGVLVAQAGGTRVREGSLLVVIMSTGQPSSSGSGGGDGGD